MVRRVRWMMNFNHSQLVKRMQNPREYMHTQLISPTGWHHRLLYVNETYWIACLCGKCLLARLITIFQNSIKSFWCDVIVTLFGGSFRILYNVSKCYESCETHRIEQFVSWHFRSMSLFGQLSVHLGTPPSSSSVDLFVVDCIISFEM